MFVLVALVQRGRLTLRLVGLFLRRLTTTFSTSLFFSFPIATMNRLSQGSEFGECDGFPHPRHFIFDAGRKSAIELVSECSVIPSGDCCEAIKLDEVLSDVLIRFHQQVFEFTFCFVDYVQRFEVSFQFRDKFSVVIFPIW